MPAPTVLTTNRDISRTENGQFDHEEAEAPARKRTRTARTQVPMSAIIVRRAVPAREVPEVRGHVPGGKRRWEDLAAQVIVVAKRDEWLEVELNEQYNPDVVRAGLSDELRRAGYRMKTHAVRAAGQPTLLYLTANRITASSRS